jgi:hypothetical protein
MVSYFLPLAHYHFLYFMTHSSLNILCSTKMYEEYVNLCLLVLLALYYFQMS